MSVFDSFPVRRRVLVRMGGAFAVAALVIALAGAWQAHAGAASATTTTAAAALPVSAVPGVSQTSYADLVSRTAPAVVTVRATRSVQTTEMPYFERGFGFPFGDEQPTVPRRERGLGSGVVVSTDGDVLTNYHVVDHADKVVVELTDGRSFTARVVGTDQLSDLALLKIAAQNLTALPFGDSDRTRVGDVVLAIGNPLGVGQTVTMGIVSGKGRTTGASEGAFEDFIQTDAPINQGNSGGALINLQGELVGINSQILSPVGYNIGIGFAIPSTMAKSVVEQLATTGSVRRGMLGVTVQQVSPDLARSLDLDAPRGAIVTDVTSGSPAARAGIEVGDVILAFNGQVVDGSNSLRNHVAPMGPGAHVNLTVRRDGKERNLAVTLAELPNREPGTRRASADNDSSFGMTLEPLTANAARQLGVRASHGALVSDIDPDGRAAESGLQVGDVIERMDGRTVEGPADVARAASAASGDRPLRLLVDRHGSRLFLTMDTARG